MMSIEFSKNCFKYCDEVSSHPKSPKFRFAQKKYWGGSSSIFSSASESELRLPIFIESLSRFFKQFEVSNFELLCRIAEIAPKNLCIALRTSEIYRYPQKIKVHKIVELQRGSHDPIIGVTCNALARLASCYSEIQEEFDRIVKSSNLDKLDVIVLGARYLEEHRIGLGNGQIEDNNSSELWHKLEMVSRLFSKFKVASLDEMVFERVENELQKRIISAAKGQIGLKNLLGALDRLVDMEKVWWDRASFDLDWDLGYEDSDIILQQNRTAQSSPEKAYQKQCAEIRFYESEAIMDMFRENEVFLRNNPDRANARFKTKIIQSHLKNGYAITDERRTISAKDVSVFVEDIQQRSLKNNSPVVSIDLQKPWDKRVQECFSLFSLNSKDKKTDFTKTPYLKIGDVGLLFPDLYQMIRPELLTIEQLVKHQKKEGDSKKEEDKRKDEGSAMGVQIANYFKNKGFATGTDIDVVETERTITDIDIAAYQNGHLFLFELKTTFWRHLHKDQLAHSQMLHKGAMQLDIILDYYNRKETDFCTLLAKNGVSVPIGGIIEIHTYIIDTSHIGDGMRFGKHPKINLHELLFALNDTAYYMNFEEPLFLAMAKEVIENGIQQHDYLTDENKLSLYATEMLKNDPACLNKMKSTVAPYCLYPNGFSPARLAEILDNGDVWNNLDHDFPQDQILAKKLNVSEWLRSTASPIDT